MINSKKKFYLIVLLLIISGAYLFIGANTNLNTYDEGIGVYSAYRTAHGDIPYRDFWSIYAPGNSYFLASLLSIFGWSIMAERIITILVLSIVCIFSFLIAARISNQSYGLFAALLYIIILGPVNLYARALPPALLFSLSAIFLLILYFYKSGNIYLLLSGICAGLAVLFRHDIGIYCFLACFISLIVYFMLAGKEKKLLGRILSVLLFIAGFLLVTIPLAIYFLSNVPFTDLYNQFIYIPFNIYPKYRSLPIPVPFTVTNFGEVETGSAQKIIKIIYSLLFYFPLIIYIFSTYKIISIYKKSDKSVIQVSILVSVLLLIICGLFFYNQALTRTDGEHLLPTQLISIILFAWLCSLYKMNFRSFLIKAAAVIFILIIPFAYKIKTVNSYFNIKNMVWFNVPRAAGISIQKDQGTDYLKTINFIRYNISANAKIYSGNTRHDKLISNDVMLYFLSERNAGVKYHELHPGVTTRSDVQYEIINSLKNNKVNYVVLHEQEDINEPNAGRFTSGVHILDDFIKNNYELEKQFGSYEILKRKNI